MKCIHEFIGQELKWQQPGALKMAYELRVMDEILATLRFRSSFSSFATAECADGCWIFKRTGFLQNKVSIYACGSEIEIAVFKKNFWGDGGWLEFTNGRRFRTTADFWQTGYAFRSETGEPIVFFRQGGFLHLSSRVAIQPPATFVPELPLLLVLGWYLIVLTHYDNGASV